MFVVVCIVHKMPDSTAFKDFVYLTRKNPFVLRLAFSAGIGGLLFGYDTGVISGALLYIRDDFSQVDRHTLLQETIVAMAVVGAIMGAGIGGWVNDRLGRRSALLVADFLFFVGAVIMAASPGPAVLITGRAFVGLGVGMASMTSPLYISEASPAKIRGALVSTNNLLITFGQFLSYLLNLAFTKVPGTWRWMLGAAGLPALLQFLLIIFLPESPRWLFRKEMKRWAARQQETTNFKELWQTKSVRRGLIAGVGLQVLQQFVGINTVMYYSPSIVQSAGYASNHTALLLSLVTAGINALGSIVSIYLIDRTGRRTILLFSLPGVAISLAMLTGIFLNTTTPMVTVASGTKFSNMTCPAPDYGTPNSASWDCRAYLSAEIQRCLWRDSSDRQANWMSNLIVALTFLSLTQSIGMGMTFMLFGIVSLVAFFFVLVCVPETKGLPIEQVEKMLEMRPLHFKFWAPNHNGGGQVN
ncbi:unnamed protein product [Linum tenue]|uniref:Major facilitator superfamily (MFS) profile domain-containing protein n=1 Tax=Linum tenue TaxID=586396 RepID=A0AAV0R2E6_9ROSI|nr:unnamed protein product [Linum tenue]